MMPSSVSATPTMAIAIVAATASEKFQLVIVTPQTYPNAPIRNSCMVTASSLRLSAV